ncbi:MBOAT family O-acyltransferase [Desulfovibrio inopinatus]|uniref:MBOAT family O-acyltransferase n=1 Tax=Desulfovibrio inopinatus TaxID=102109 RepID=UPI000415AB48|nr:MBOAT family protein [Desulfovibrio inopinatus]
MVFSSAAFLFFFLPIVMAIYFPLVKYGTLRNVILIIASLFFYAWGEGGYVLVMIGSIVINYFFALWVDRTRALGKSRLPITLCIIFNISLLIVFKYTNFIVDNLNLGLDAMGIAPIDIGHVHLPIGVSFFTFHCVSYILDIYRKQTSAQTSFTNTALYIALFPQLVAGPIVRYKDVAEQLTYRIVSIERFSKGINRFIVGLGKKVLVANVVALPADKIFAIPPDQLTTPVAWLGIICYTIQIYFDFSGYSDMAIGLANMFGFKFLENFNYPYISKSIREFWRRWHISLSTWFRDYLYIPMGGSRVAPWRVYFNLVTVFFLCGLWHGASWNFIIWGLFHGLFLVLERTPFGRMMDRAPSIVGHCYTLLTVMVAWVFFRAETLDMSLAYVSALFGFAQGSGVEWHVGLYLNPKVIAVIAAGIIGSMPIVPLIRNWRERIVTHHKHGSIAIDDGIESVVSILLLPAVFVLCVMSLASGTHNPFIYFQF